MRIRSGWRPWVVTTVAGSGLAALALTIAVVLPWSPLVSLDTSLNTRAYALGQAHPDWVRTWKVITHGGGAYFLCALWALATLILVGLGRRWSAVVLALAVLGSQLVFRALRLVVDRPRPPAGFFQISAPSYPSGHTMGAATGAILLGILLWPVVRGSLARTLLLVALVTWAVLVGLSRVFLSVHWPTDVLAGWLCAVLLVPAAYAGAQTWVRSRAGEPVGSRSRVAVVSDRVRRGGG